MKYHLKKTKYWLFCAAFGVTLSGCDGLLELSEAEHIQRAKEFQASGDLRSSIIELKSTLQQNPDNAEARLLLGRISAVGGNPAAAEKDLRRAMVLGVPRNQVLMPLTEAMLRMGKYQAILDEVDAPETLPVDQQARLIAYRGESWLLLMEFDKAKAEYQRALAISSKSPLAKLGLARLAMANSDETQALSLLEEAVQLAPDNSKVLTVQGDFYHFLGDRKKAEASFSKVVNLNQVDHIARVKRALVRIDEKDFTGAEQDILFLKDKVPDFYLVHYVDGLKAFAQKQYPQAQTAFEEALRLNSGYVKARYYLSGAHLMQQHLSQAQDNVVAFLTRYPKSLKGRRLMAEVRYKLKDFEGAREVLTVLLEEYPDDLGALKLMGNLEFAVGNEEQGLAYLQDSVELDPTSAGARVRLGLGKLLSGDRQQGLKELYSAVEMDPGMSDAEAYIAYTHIQNKEFKQAMKVIDDLQKKQPDSLVAFNLLGALYMKQGEAEKARAILEAGLKTSPGAPTLSHSLAQLALQRGDSDEAKRVYENVLSIHPKHNRTRLKLAELDANAGRVRQVEAKLTEIINDNPEDLKSRLILADYLLVNGGAARSQIMLEGIQGKYPDDPGLLSMLVKAQLANREANKALLTAKHLASVADSAPAQFLLAKAYGGVEDVRQMRTALEQALTLDPKFFRARAEMIKVLVSEGKSSEAKQALKTLSSKYPKHPHIIALQAWLSLQNNQPKQAVKLYQKLMDLAPTNANVTNLVDAQWRAGDQKTALATLAEWSETHPGDAQIYYLRASLYQSIGDEAKAQIQLLKSIELNPNNAPALNNLAWMLRKDNPDQAHRYAEQAVALSPQPQMLDTMGMILMEKSRFLDAVRLFEQAVGKAPGDPSLRYHLATAQAKSGQTGLAAESLQKAIASGVAFQEKAEAEKLLLRLNNNR